MNTAIIYFLIIVSILHCVFLRSKHAKAKHPGQLKNKFKLKHQDKKKIVIQSGSYLVQRIRASANCKLIGLSRIGLFDEERAPLMHMIEDRNKAKLRRHLSQPIV